MRRKVGAQEKTRTSTSFRKLAPEASASTNSATWAQRSWFARRTAAEAGAVIVATKAACQLACLPFGTFVSRLAKGPVRIFAGETRNRLCNLLLRPLKALSNRAARISLRAALR